MESLATAILDQTGTMFGYAEGILKDVTPELFARKPEGKNGLINTNHPAFCFGHLAIYPARICQLAGIEDAGIAAPAGFDELFEAGKDCQDDPDGAIYPAMGVVTAAFFDGYKTAIAKLGELSDAHLAAHHGLDSEFGKRFNSRAAVANFMLGPHTFMHIGQLSAWRRCMGLGPVF